MIVMKFGGTSLGDADRILRVTELVRARRNRRPLVVVSAFAGVTNHLLAAAAAAQAGDRAAADEQVAALVARHDAVIDGLRLDAALDAEARATVRQAFAQLRDLVHGVLLLGECSARTRDAVASLGEMISHRIVSLALRSAGIASHAIDPRQVMRTDDRFGEAAPDARALAAACAERIAPLLGDGVPVTGGFVGATADGVTTTLGRGGSDLSATLFGVALDAEDVEIWTDVDGLMTADPRVVPGARTLPSVSFDEASELAYFGARVLHPATITPAVEKRIPVSILNTFRPEGAGTVIGDGASADGAPCVRAVAWKEGITLVSVETPRMLGAVGFLSRAFAAFERHRTPVDVVTTSEVSVSMTVDRADRLDAIERELREIGRVHVERGMSLACVVGRGLPQTPRLVGDILRTLDGIPLRLVSLGSSAINLSLVVAQQDAREVVTRIHARFVETT